MKPRLQRFLIALTIMVVILATQWWLWNHVHQATIGSAGRVFLVAFSFAVLPVFMALAQWVRRARDAGGASGDLQALEVEPRR